MTKFLKAIIASLIKFLVPTIIPVIFRLFINDYNDSKFKVCNTCLFEPSSDDCLNIVKLYRDSKEEIEQEDIFIFNSNFDTSSLYDVPENIRDNNYKTGSSSYSSASRECVKGNPEELLNAYGGSMGEKEINNNFLIIDGEERQAKELISSSTLKAGDIVLWYDTGHNFIGGHGTMDDYHFTSFGPFRITFYEDSTVWKILRLRA